MPADINHGAYLRIEEKGAFCVAGNLRHALPAGPNVGAAIAGCNGAGDLLFSSAGLLESDCERFLRALPGTCAGWNNGIGDDMLVGVKQHGVC